MHRASAGSRWLFIAGAASLFASAGIMAGDNDEDSRSPWQVTVGGGLGLRPEFPGSDSTEVRPLPAFDITYGERWFFNNGGLGAYIVNNDAGMLSASVTLDLTHRDEADSDHLRGTGDIDRTAVALLKGGYRFGRILALLAVATDIADEGHGTVADLVLQTRSQLTPKLALDYGVAARWANDEYVQTFFGVDMQQSAQSDLPMYTAGSGLADARAFVNAVYALSPHWIISTGGSVARLQGDAADSPITEDESYFTFDAAVLYRF